jgi:chloramphenicol-sensitive protein RarD
VNDARRGILYGVLAYGLWGIVPVFWKQLHGLGALELLCHRIVWGLVTLLLLTVAMGRGGEVRRALRDRRVVGAMAASSVLLAINWGLFVYAVGAGRLLEASMGYFINPLVSVSLGVFVLGERLRRAQYVAIGAAAVGVALLAMQRGVPYLALALAASFGLYGLVRKTANVDALAGTTIETGWIAPLAVLWLVSLGARGDGAIGHADVRTHVLVLATGVVTAVPLLLFTGAARRLPLSTVGFVQYLAPTLQFLLAVVVYREPFSAATLAAFSAIWVGLAVFSYDAWRR